MKKKLRRIYLLAAIAYPPYIMRGKDFTIGGELARYKDIWKHCRPSHVMNAIELLELFTELKFSDRDALELWKECFVRRTNAHNVYKKRPIRIRKDNKDVINYGSGGSNSHSIRYPRKCRKTAWKRFYKLFPGLKPEENEKEKTQSK